jgi:hypothetical protein
MSKLISAPELKLRINGVDAGYVTSIVYRVTQGQKEIFGVDSPMPQEIAQGAGPVIVQGSITVLRPKGASPEAWGIMTSRSGNNGVIDTGDRNSSVAGAGAYSVVEILDRETDNLLIRITYVMFGIQEWRVQARQVMTGSIGFTGVIAEHHGNTNTKNSFF